MAIPTAPALTPLARAIVLLRAARDAAVEVLELDLDELDPEQAEEIEEARDYLRAAYHPLEIILSFDHGGDVAAWHRAEIVALAIEDLDDDDLVCEVSQMRRDGEPVPKHLLDRCLARGSA